MSNSYGIRSVVRHGDSLYEERIVLFDAISDEQAFALARDEADEYCKDLSNAQPLDFYQLFKIDEGPIANGSEVFSLMRDSDLSAEDYLSRFFDTGDELGN